MSAHVVDRGGDSPIEFCGVHLPYVELVERGCREKVLLSPGSPFYQWSLCMDIMMILTMITKCNCTNHSIL
jgi:hypothetical protein